MSMTPNDPQRPVSRLTGGDPLTAPTPELKLVGGDVALRIAMDIGNGVAPEDSILDYGPDDLAFRARVEQEFAAYRKKFPGAILDVRE